jgi:hypothetical protein
MEEKIFSWMRALEVNVVESIRDLLPESGTAGYVLILCHEMREELEKTKKGKALLKKPRLSKA